MTLANIGDDAPLGGGLMVYEDPELLLARQTKAANALMHVISDQKDSREDGKNPFMAKISGKDFLTYESWSLLARMNNAHVELEGRVEPVYDSPYPESDDKAAIVAWSAVCVVIDNATGVRLARAEMECGSDSFPTQGKQGREKVKAAQSAAQTWAGAKACRMVFSFVAVLAGFEAATAEEMTPSSEEADGGGDPEPEGVECPSHPGEHFFKSGKMKGYAHKYDGDTAWHNWSPSIFDVQMKAQAVRIGWTTGVQVNEYIKEAFNGKTYSRLDPGETMELLEFMVAMPDAPQTEATQAPA